MRILVVVGFVIPDAARLINLPVIPTGGWVSTLVDGLLELDEIEVGVVMKHNSSLRNKICSDNIVYYYVPDYNRIDVSESDVVYVLDDFKPDILHTEGSEIPMYYSFMKKFNGKKILSVKGVFCDVNKNELFGFSLFNILKLYSLYSFVFYIIVNVKILIINRRRVVGERKAFELTDYVIGRTLYDRSYSYSLNKNIKYFSNNETLRAAFYLNHWSSDNIEMNSIFVGNGNLARKGVHIVLSALNELKNDFPFIKLYVVGKKPNGFMDKFSYPNILMKLIHKYNLEKHVVFLNRLNETEMCNSMLNKHVYVLPSLVENSSNTLGEAMLLGMPCVVAYSGGVSSLALDEKEVLFYRRDSVQMLSYQIRRVFENNDLCKILSSNSSKRASLLYNKQRNLVKLKSIYRSILEE